MLKKKIKKITVLVIIIICPFFMSLFFNSYTSIAPINISNNVESTNNGPNLSAKTVKLISNNPESDSIPVIAIDSSNITHIAWVAYDSVEGKNNIMYTNSSDFSNIIQISNTSTNDDNPCIAVDSADIVHIAWEGSSDLYYTNSSINFGNHTLVSQQSDIDDPQIACDSSGVIHLVWEGYQSGNWDIFYANSSDNFKSNKQISPNTLDDEEPDVCVSNGIVYIVWEKAIDSYDDVIVYRNSSDYFSTERTISQNGDKFYCPKITADNNGNIYIVWMGRTDSLSLTMDQLYILIFVYIYLPYFNDNPFVPPNYYYSRYSSLFYPSPYFLSAFQYSIFYSSSINDFQTQLEISKPVDSDSYWPDIVVDSNNICHIIWYGYSSSSFMHSYLFYTNSTENFQVFKRYAFDTYNKYPRIANDTGNVIHCVFQTYYNNYDVYYLNTSDFQIYTETWSDLLYPLQIYAALPKIPDMSLFAISILAILCGFNVTALFIYFYNGGEKSANKPEEKKGNKFTKKKKGNKIIIEKNGKKMKTRVP
ncbi:MAG: hypothetical protein ACTSRG_09640 [Candidatus Helarchaeota archaeon]